MQGHPYQKQPKYSKTSCFYAEYPSTFTYGIPGRCTALQLPVWITSSLVWLMYAIHWKAPTDWLSPIWYPPLGTIPTVSGLRNIVRNTLLQMDDIVIDCRKGSIFTNLKKQISKSTACLPQCIGVIHVVDQQFFLIVEKFVFLLPIPYQKLGSFIALHKVCPYYLGSE